MSNDDFVPAERLFAYMEKYTEKFQLLDCVRLNSKAYKIEKDENSSGWNVWITVNGSSGEDPLYCDKLILAIGLTSQPNVLSLLRDEFKPPTFHFQELGVRHTLLVSSAVSRVHVAVYGGGKSALDVVGTCVGLGKHVD